MNRFLDEETYYDLRLKYSGCWGWKEVEGIKLPVRITDMSYDGDDSEGPDDGGCLTLYFLEVYPSEKGIKSKEYSITTTGEEKELDKRISDLKFKFIQQGYYNYTAGKISVARHQTPRPYRQYKIAPNKYNMYMNSIGPYDLLRNKELYNGAVHKISDIFFLFNPTYVPIDQAVSMILSKKAISIALSRNMAITVSTAHKAPLVLYNTIPVGLLNTDTLEVSLFPEAQDFFAPVSECLPIKEVI